MSLLRIPSRIRFRKKDLNGGFELFKTTSLARTIATELSDTYAFAKSRPSLALVKGLTSLYSAVAETCVGFSEAVAFLGLGAVAGVSFGIVVADWKLVLRRKTSSTD